MALTDLQFSRKMGNIVDPVSDYQPSDAVKDITAIVKKDFQTANRIITKPYFEFNDKTLVQRMNIDQKSFNSWQDLNDTDPDLAWKSQAVRPITRNKIISIAAHVLSSIIYPTIYAQNENQEEDKDSAAVMRLLVEWVGDNYNYAQTLVYSVIAALVNPAAIIHLEFAEKYRNIKIKDEKGKIITKEILDEIFSGFQFTVVPCDELLISNIYEHNIQKQNFLIWRKILDFDTAKAKYGDNYNFKKYVKPGVQRMYDEASKTFYDLYDRNLFDTMVEEVIYWNRNEDIKLTFVNNVCLDKPNEPNPRADHRYPFVKFGYELIDEGKFFYYKSLAFKGWPDQEVINNLYRGVIDGTYLQLKPPVAVYGDEHFESSIVAPGAISVLKNTTKVEKIDVGGNLVAGFNAMQKVEQSMNETSVDPRQSGQATSGQETAFEISILEKNAQIQGGLFKKMISFGVKDFGELLGSDILQFMTVGDVEEIAGGLKYKSFLIPGKGGMDTSKQVNFDSTMSSEPQTEEKKLLNSYQILEEQGGMDSKKEIFKVNPEIFRRRKFLFRVNPDEVTQPSEAIKKALLLEEFDRAVQSPLANQEAIFKDLLLGAYEKTKNNPDDYINKQPAMPQQGMNNQGSPLSNVLGGGMNNQKQMAMMAS